MKTFKRNIHPLLDEKTQTDIFFQWKENDIICLSYGKNPLNGKWMWWTDKYVTMWTGSKKLLNVFIKGFKKNHEILHHS
jgi:hypothetical protein